MFKYLKNLNVFGLLKALTNVTQLYRIAQLSSGVA